MIIDAKGERAARWYESFGAERLRDQPEGHAPRLVLHLTTFATDLRASGHL
jgi:hypothetical protein